MILLKSSRAKTRSVRIRSRDLAGVSRIKMLCSQLAVLRGEPSACLGMEFAGTLTFCTSFELLQGLGGREAGRWG